MGIPLTLGDAVDATNVAIQKMWVKSAGAPRPSYYDKYFNTETGVTDRLLKDSSLTGLGEAARIPEQAIITGEAPVQGFDKTYTQVEFGKLMSVTKQMWKFGIKKRDMEGVTQELRFACERKREGLCGDRIDNMTATSYSESDDSGNYTVATTGGDAKAFHSTSHTREDAGTDNNNQIYDGTTYNMDLDYDAIKAAHRTASLIRDGKGNLMDINLDTLLCKKGHANQFRAMEILGAVKAGGKGSMPASADNDASGVSPFKILAIPYIVTNTGYWGMFDSSMVNAKYGFQYKESQPIQLEGPNVVFKTGEQIKKIALYWRKLISSFSQIRWISPIMETIPSQAL